jgi:hypothetical protein
MIEETRATNEAGGNQRGMPRRWLACVALLFLAQGLVFVAIGYVKPAYVDPIAAERIRSGIECERGIPNTDENLRCNSTVWHRSMGALRTEKWTFIDAGGGLLASALTLFGFSWWSGQKSWRQLSTARSAWSVLALVSLSWLVQIPAHGLFFLTEGSRDYYPHWADSIAIPMFEIQNLVLGLFLPYIFIWMVFVVGARLSVPVLLTVSGRPIVNIFWTAAAALLVVPICLYLTVAILYGPILMVPFLWLTLWLALCARAAALSRHQSNRTSATAY